MGTSKTSVRIRFESTEHLEGIVGQIKKLNGYTSRGNPKFKWHCFESRTHKPYTEGGFETMWKRYMKKALDSGELKESFQERDLRAKAATQCATLVQAFELLGHKNISTTKKNMFGGVKKPKSKYEDWGIFGLGYRPGPSCIVSTYRLGKKSKKRSNRLVKITLHEIGHNMGLPHCDRDPNCVMRDAAESIKTVDQVSKDLCEFCRKDIE